MRSRPREVPASRIATKTPPSGTRPIGAVSALLQAGTRARRLAALLVVVVGGFAAQGEAEALDVSKRDVLYLDAPAVSEERAARAGEVAASLPTAGSAESETLAWLAVTGVSARKDTAPGSVARALASVTARDGAGEGGVTPSDAALAGEVMVAQLEEPPAGNEGDGAELASTEAVRPTLGDRSEAEEEAEPAGPEDEERTGRPVGAEYASIGESPADTPAPLETVPVVEPEGSAGVTLPAPAYEEEPTPLFELASAPNETAFPPSDPGSDGEPPGTIDPVLDTVGDEPPSAGAFVEEPAEKPDPEREAPTAGPTGLEEGEFALAPVSDSEDDRSVPAEEGPQRIPASPPSEEDRAGDEATEPPTPSGEASDEGEAPETTLTETSPHVAEQRVEIVAVDEDASDADVQTSDEPLLEPEIREAPRIGSQEPAEGQEPPSEGGIETLRSEDREPPDEEGRRPADGEVEVPEEATADEDARIPERPGEGERVERRSAEDRPDRDLEADPSGRVERIESTDGGGEAVQEEVSDLAGASGEDGTTVGEPKPVPTKESAPVVAPTPRWAPGEEEPARTSQPAERGVVERQTIVVRQASPDREAVRTRQTVEPENEPSAAHQMTE